MRVLPKIAIVLGLVALLGACSAEAEPIDLNEQAYEMSQEFMLDRLPVPDSTLFYEYEDYMTSKEGEFYLVTSELQTESEFGVYITLPYQMILAYEESTQMWELVNLNY